MDFVDISSLEQHGADLESKFIRGIITIIWPFSSSAGKASFLLADPDFRLRYRKGQVRIQLQGSAALAVAKSKLAIGDEVALGLKGARLVETEAGVSTPGKSVDLELRFGHILSLEVS
jgi:hypothetical protein